MTDMPGFGVLVNLLFEDGSTTKAVQASIGKRIKDIKVVETPNVDADHKLEITLDDESKLSLLDAGRSCCELRYMSTDDNLGYHVGATLMRIELASAPDEEDEYGVHEVEFLRIITSNGIVTVANHNEHNGYYGGFHIKAELVEPEREAEREDEQGEE